MRVIELSPTLSSAAHGEMLARQVLDLLASGDTVQLDFTGVRIMTPSFANTLLMTLLAQHDIEYLRSQCQFIHRSPHVIQAMNRAVERFRAGIRLSSQLASA